MRKLISLQIRRNGIAVHTFILSCALLFGTPDFCAAQKKIVVLGSSTAEGWGATSYATSWVGKYTSYLQSINASVSVINLASAGFATRSVMPTGTGGEDPQRNITKALTYNPDAIIVNLPSNDAANGTSVATTMANFRVLRQVANNAGVSFWITTTQPRNLSADRRSLLTAVRDSIYAQFGAFAIDFWTTIANADGTIHASFDAGDGVHINDSAHGIFFQRVKEKPVLGSGVLTSTIQNFSAIRGASGIQLSWDLYAPQDVVQEIQRSKDGASFTTIGAITAHAGGQKTFGYLDAGPVSGKTFYRVKSVSAFGIKYSALLHIPGEPHRAQLSAFPNPVSGNHFQLQIGQNEYDGRGNIVLYNTAGKAIFQKPYHFSKGVSAIRLELPGTIGKGVYFAGVDVLSNLRPVCILLQ